MAAICFTTGSSGAGSSKISGTLFCREDKDGDRVDFNGARMIPELARREVLGIGGSVVGIDSAGGASGNESL